MLATLRPHLGERLRCSAPWDAQGHWRFGTSARLCHNASAAVLELVAQKGSNVWCEVGCLFAHLSQHRCCSSLLATSARGKGFCDVLRHVVRMLTEGRQGSDGCTAHDHIVISQALANTLGVARAECPHLGEVEQRLRLGVLVIGRAELGNFGTVQLGSFSKFGKCGACSTLDLRQLIAQEGSNVFGALLRFHVADGQESGCPRVALLALGEANESLCKARSTGAHEAKGLASRADDGFLVRSQEACDLRLVLGALGTHLPQRHDGRDDHLLVGVAQQSDNVVPH
mmetsp:Transcript_27208/g.62028  ORF Transcript_27208/g.62028 Transcript_27208/m.62028 type:complete len:285 (-) Transcript_27208:173-1027(-)